MKKNKIIIATFLLLNLASCVQKSSKKTIVVRLNVEGAKDIQNVGMRGSEKPLSWRNDMPLKAIKKDSLYETSFSLVTGYKFTEAKFTINGDFELQDKDNRKIMFTNGDTTVYEATYNVVNK